LTLYFRLLLDKGMSLGWLMMEAWKSVPGRGNPSDVSDEDGRL